MCGVHIQALWLHRAFLGAGGHITGLAFANRINNVLCCTVLSSLYYNSWKEGLYFFCLLVQASSALTTHPRQHVVPEVVRATFGLA